MANQDARNRFTNESWWGKYRATFRALFIAAAVFGFLWLVAQAVWLAGIKAIWGYVVDSIQDVTGLNTFLARVVATVGAIPLLWGIADVFSFKSKRRSFSFTVIALYILLFNAAMYAATRNQNVRFVDGEVMRYCAVTPKGAYCADKPGFDPTYGMKLEPMTPDRIRLVEAYEKRLASGYFQPIELLHETPVFDPVTGEAVLYYTTLPNGEHRFFNGPGFDAASGAELKPASPALIEAYWRGLEQAKQAREKAVQAEQSRQLQLAETRKREEQEQVQTERIKARKAELMDVLNSPHASSSQLDVAVMIRVSEHLDRQSSNKLIGALESGTSSVRFHDAVFRSSFLYSNQADELFDGNLHIWKEARKFGLLPDMDRVLVGSLDANCAPGYQGTTRCDVSFEYHAFDADGELLGDGVVHEVGAGFDRRGATEAGLARVAEKLRANSQTLVKG